MAAHLYFVHSIAHYQLQKISLHIKNSKAHRSYHKGLYTKSVALWHFTAQQSGVHVPPIKCIPAGNTFVHNAYDKAQKVLFIKTINNIYYPPDCI